MKALRLVPVVVLALSGVLVGAGSASVEPPPPSHAWGHPYKCAGGNVDPGTYDSMIITGICYMPAGNINIQGNLTITPGALLDAVNPGDPTTGTPVVPATVFVGGNVTVGRGAVLLHRLLAEHLLWSSQPRHLLRPRPWRSRRLRRPGGGGALGID